MEAAETEESTRKLSVHCFQHVAYGVTGVAAMFLVAVMIVYTLPFSQTLPYDQTSCTVINSTWTAQMVGCVCSEVNSTASQCLSAFPCLQVFVRYSTRSNGQVNGLMVEDMDALSGQALGAGPVCSWYGCSTDQNKNKESAEEYASLFSTTGTSITCYHEDGNNVVLRSIVTKANFAHLIVWPACVVLIGLGAVAFSNTKYVRVCFKKKKRVEDKEFYVNNASSELTDGE